MIQTISSIGFGMCFSLMACGSARPSAPECVPRGGAPASVSAPGRGIAAARSCERCGSCEETTPSQTKPSGLDLRLIPIGRETGGLLGALEDSRGMTISNAPYGGLGDTVDNYLLLACGPLGERHRRMDITILNSGTKVESRLAPDYGFSLEGVYCRGRVIALSGCDGIEVEAELDQVGSLRRQYYFDCRRGE